MTTPEERARAVVLAWYRGPHNVHDYYKEKADIEIADIADAIRAAIEAEREACAQIAERYEFLWGGDVDIPPTIHDTIRARGGKEG
jgi:hypothetical protein